MSDSDDDMIYSVRFTVIDGDGDRVAVDQQLVRSSDIYDTVGKDRARARHCRGTACAFFERGYCRAGINCGFLHLREDRDPVSEASDDDESQEDDQPPTPPPPPPPPPRRGPSPPSLPPPPPPSPLVKMLSQITHSSPFTAHVDVDFSYIDAGKVPKDLECVICMSPWVHPIEMDCGHIFCRGCLEGAMSVVCSICRGETKGTRVPNRALVNIVNSLSVKCVRPKCTWKGPREEFTNHKCVGRVEQLKTQGNDLFNKNDFEGALKKYSEGLQVDPTNAVLFCNRSLSYLRLRRMKEARDDAMASIQHDSKWARGYERLGTVSMEEGKLQEAKDAFTKGLKMDPQDAGIQRLLQQCDAKIAEAAKQAQNNNPMNCIEELDHNRYLCTLCRIIIAGGMNNVRQHVQGRNHLAKLGEPKKQPQEKQQQQQQAKSAQTGLPRCVVPLEERNRYLCEICGVVISGGPVNVQQHVNGQAHRTRVVHPVFTDFVLCSAQGKPMTISETLRVRIAQDTDVFMEQIGQQTFRRPAVAVWHNTSDYQLSVGQIRSFVLPYLQAGGTFVSVGQLPKYSTCVPGNRWTHGRTLILQPDETTTFTIQNVKVGDRLLEATSGLTISAGQNYGLGYLCHVGDAYCESVELSEHICAVIKKRKEKQELRDDCSCSDGSEGSEGSDDDDDYDDDDQDYFDYDDITNLDKDDPLYYFYLNLLSLRS